MEQLEVEKQPWARSCNRSIDPVTIIDLLGYVAFCAKKSEVLEAAGFADQNSEFELLYDFVLDALGVPPHNKAVSRGDKTLYFTRHPFYEIFFSDYLLQEPHQNMSLEYVVSLIKDRLEEDDVSLYTNEAEGHRLWGKEAQ